MGFVSYYFAHTPLPKCNNPREVISGALADLGEGIIGKQKSAESQKKWTPIRVLPF